MHRSALRGAITAAAAVTTTLVATLGGLAYPAQADVSVDAAQNQIKIAKSSGLFGEGAVIVLDAKVRCSAGTVDAWIYIQLSQVGGPFGTVYGNGEAPVACTGETDTIPIAVIGYSPFDVGDAFVSAELQACDDFGCSSAEHNREITVAVGTREVRSFSSDDLNYKLPKIAEIQAGGAGAVALVPYTCATGLNGYFDAVLAQATDDEMVNTSRDGSELHCTESSRTGVLAFHASGPGWEQGEAFLLVIGYACQDGPDPCTNGTTYRSTKLV